MAHSSFFFSLGDAAAAAFALVLFSVLFELSYRMKCDRISGSKFDGTPYTTPIYV